MVDVVVESLRLVEVAVERMWLVDESVEMLWLDDEAAERLWLVDVAAESLWLVDDVVERLWLDVIPAWCDDLCLVWPANLVCFTLLQVKESKETFGKQSYVIVLL